MSQFNIWLGMSPAFREAITPDETGQMNVNLFTALNTLEPETVDMLLNTQDVPSQERLFVASGANRLYSHYGQSAGATLVKSDVDMLIAQYPSDLTVLGAWEFSNGREAGATYSEVEPFEQTAPGWYPVPAGVLAFMPDIWNGDEPPTYTPPTDPVDVNLLSGQSSRDFTSFYP